VTKIDPESKMVTVNGKSLSYDALILAPGGEAVHPPLPGLDLPHVQTLRTVDDAKDIKNAALSSENAVVLGGGFIGIEAAEALVARGLNVSLIELADHILPPAETEIAALATRELERLGVHVRPGIGAQQVTESAVKLTDGSEVPADLVVLSVGVKPDTYIYEAAGVETKNGAIITDGHGRTNIPGIWAAGDATLRKGMVRPVALAGPAGRAGRFVADDIFNPENAREIPLPLGTAIVRIGKLTVAMTGENRQALGQRDFHTIHLHSSQHAGYFPGSKPISLLIHFSEDGTILGAQAAGEEGVDKRIDILATAIRAGLNVEDLIDLDLAYSPPYGSAKDPVNMAGMLAQNVIQGKTKLWYTGDLEWALENALIIDVRSEKEYDSGHIQEAINIPHTQIRDRLGKIKEIANGRPIRLICKSGMRSYLAFRVLAQNGLDVATFSGGMSTLIDTLGNQAMQKMGA
jgi:NAD(P)H-nitrite reductase